VQSAVPANRSVDVTVYLRMRNFSKATALLRQVSTPGTASYGRYLTNSQFSSRFAPTAAEVSRLSSWLRSQGLRVTSVAPNRTWINASGTASAAERAFATHLVDYRYHGATRQAVSSAISVPSSLAGSVASVGGLSEATLMKPNAIPSAPPSPGFKNAHPCSAYWGQKMATTLPKAFGQTQPYAPCGYDPAQLRGAYGLGAARTGWDGAGATVAFVDAYDSPTELADANTYSSRHGLAPFAAGQYTDISPSNLSAKQNGRLCGDWYGEQTLDLEAIHTMAPAANVVYSGGRSCFDNALLDALHKIVDTDRAQVISNSWGNLGEVTDPSTIDAFDQLFVQAGLKGIGIYYSSGDNGDEVSTIGSRQADFPADDPFVTGVGGTSLGVGKDNQRLFETGWGTGKSFLTNGSWLPYPGAPRSWVYGGGGGTSTVFPEPWYQKGVVPNSLSMYFGSGGLAAGGRVVPDVAMVGDPTTGMLVGQTQLFPNGTRYDEYRIGGTSLSSPLFAGLMAVADAQAGMRHGFANPALYSISGTNAYNDVVSPRHRMATIRVDYVNGFSGGAGTFDTLRVLNDTQSLHTMPGYDDVTGNGTPRAAQFLALLNRAG
jgi:subtilase family serine protease